MSIIKYLKLKYYNLIGITKIYYFIEWNNINKIYKYKRWSNKRVFWLDIFIENFDHKYILKQYTKSWKIFKVDLNQKKRDYKII